MDTFRHFHLEPQPPVLSPNRCNIGSFMLGIGTYILNRSKRYSRANLYDWMEHEVRALPNGDALKILNVGAGGEVYDRIRALTAHTIIQIDNDASRNPDVVTSVCDMPTFADGTFDAVFMMEVLEHVTEPHLAVNELLRVLKPGGKLIISTPFIFPIHDEPYDFFRYTKFGLLHLMRGFDIVDLRERNDAAGAVRVLCARMAIKGTRRQRLAGSLLFSASLILIPLIQWIAGPAEGVIRATTGYFVTARKPS